MFQILASTLSTILENRQTVVENEANFGPKQKIVRLCQYDDLDKAMLKWIRGIRDRNRPISGTLMQEKAVEFSKTLGYPDFKASAGWLDKFKKLHGLTQKSIYGESEDVPEEVCDCWMQKIPDILQEFSPQNIFNADETGLFFKCLPTKSRNLGFL
ncbi:Tigger transposable element-derived protein 6 [Araneus ventricosus]|uniref:Tigger transposable element-derived protein 6 n=1 Tax=Araneus ventricosus TaxID=182803 RepID=A0A4Y2NIS1_ARAVE|nr:Tigger transposable element-derived protein 6 [Araneus ventricosus]GBN38607.1 Tigger transposable element-derived protein 6 [Araneus ventricosus]GBN40035.1 Tigger transposable element-derived protein 6 [Araneus ventricosus]GBN40039.1 Tigger transposable element-derived protein 6 [Araneus ventricosus]